MNNGTEYKEVVRIRESTRSDAPEGQEKVGETFSSY